MAEIGRDVSRRSLLAPPSGAQRNLRALLLLLLKELDQVALFDPPRDEATRLAREAKRASLRADDERRHAATRAGLSQVPRFELPHRTYYLMSGPLSAVTSVAEPGEPTTWRRPDLFWPDDRRWLVATDVDFWSLCIGGDHAFIVEAAASVPTDSEPVTLDTRLEVED